MNEVPKETNTNDLPITNDTKIFTTENNQTETIETIETFDTDLTEDTVTKEETQEETYINEEADEFYKEKFSINYENAISNTTSIFRGVKYRFTVLSDILIRIEYSETGSFEDRPTELAKFRKFPETNVVVTQDEKILNLKTEYFELIYEKDKPVTGTKLSPDQYLKVKLLETNKVWFIGQAEARNYKSLTSSLDGITNPMLLKTKLEKGLYSTDGFVSIDDSKSLIFNEDGSVGKRSDNRVDIYLFMYRKDFGFCLKDYYRLTGYPPLIPRYALGIWWNKDEVYDTNSIYSILNKFKKYQIPLSVFLFNKWSKNNVKFDENIISAPGSVIKELHDHQIRVGLTVNTDKVLGKMGETEVEVPFNVYDKNFIYNYFENIIKNLNELGVDFYAINHTTKDIYALRMINHYFFTYLSKEQKKRGLILSKNGLKVSHLYPVYNSGEIYVDWGTLKMLPEYNSTSSNIGVSWWSHAIGGFKEGIEEDELYTRFIQFGTYSPIFRLSSKGGRFYKREPWSWGVKTRKIVTDYMQLRHRLIPYLYSEAYKYAKTGLPLVQPLYYRYPELYDEPTYKNEYYFGTEMFIVPITERKDDVMNRSVVRIFLPNGIWYDFKTGKKFPGGKRYISFYEDDDYPVFVKQGGIIPLAILDDNINSTTNPTKMEIHIFPGKTSNYKLYEDDGTTMSYKEGNFLTTAIDYNYLPNNFTVIIRPLEGKTSVIPEKRVYKIRFRNTRHADEVIAYLGANKIEVKSYLEDNDFIVETKEISTSEQLSINCKGQDIEIDAIRLINEEIDKIINDLRIKTTLKEKIASIIFSKDDIKKKRIAIRKLHAQGLSDIFVRMFLKLLEYVSDI